MAFYLEKCNKPPLENGFFSGTKESFKIGEKLQYRCDSGYHSPSGNTEETIQCRTEGWSSQPACAKMSGMWLHFFHADWLCYFSALQKPYIWIVIN